jgi:hypothetical protein
LRLQKYENCMDNFALKQKKDGYQPS